MSPGLGATVTAAGFQTESKPSVQLLQQGRENLPALRNELNLDGAHAPLTSLRRRLKLQPDSSLTRNKQSQGRETDKQTHVRACLPVKEREARVHPLLHTHTGPQNESGRDGPRAGRVPEVSAGGRGPGLGGQAWAPGVEHAQAASTVTAPEVEGPPRAERRLQVVPASARPILPVAAMIPRAWGPQRRGASQGSQAAEWTPDRDRPHVCCSQDDEDGLWRVHAGRKALAACSGLQ